MKEIVIKIPEKLYEECVRLGDKNDTLFEAIRRGVILPKGHGRLIDADKYKKKLIWNENLDNAPTIVEADKEEEPSP